jgi:hypothetical protein
MTTQKLWTSPRIVVEAFEAKLDCACRCGSAVGGGGGTGPHG